MPPKKQQRSKLESPEHDFCKNVSVAIRSTRKPSFDTSNCQDFDEQIVANNGQETSLKTKKGFSLRIGLTQLPNMGSQNRQNQRQSGSGLVPKLPRWPQIRAAE